LGFVLIDFPTKGSYFGYWVISNFQLPANEATTACNIRWLRLYSYSPLSFMFATRISVKSSRQGSNSLTYISYLNSI